MDKKMAREIVESLPSLYPSMSAEEEEAIWAVLENDSAERLDTLIKALEQEHKKLREMQKAQPEVILCKDCKFNPKYEWFGCPMSHLSEKQRHETAWCWKGVRNDHRL